MTVAPSSRPSTRFGLCSSADPPRKSDTDPSRESDHAGSARFGIPCRLPAESPGEAPLAEPPRIDPPRVRVAKARTFNGSTDSTPFARLCVPGAGGWIDFGCGRAVRVRTTMSWRCWPAKRGSLLRSWIAVRSTIEPERMPSADFETLRWFPLPSEILAELQGAGVSRATRKVFRE